MSAGSRHPCGIFTFHCCLKVQVEFGFFAGLLCVIYGDDFKGRSCGLRLSAPVIPYVPGLLGDAEEALQAVRPRDSLWLLEMGFLQCFLLLVDCVGCWDLSRI